MKILFLIHVPPPFNGHTFMNQLLLEGLRERLGRGGPDAEAVEPVHVDCRISQFDGEIGRTTFAKICRMVGFIVRAVWMGWRTGARVLYFVPSAAVRPTLYRDWLLLGACRPFFERTILHWHGAIFGRWLEREARPWERAMTLLTHGRSDLSILLKEDNLKDVGALAPRRVCVVHNGIPDPFPDFDDRILPGLRGRVRDRLALLAEPERSRPDATNERSMIYQVLYLATCTADKGLFDALDCIVEVNRMARANALPLRFKLVVAGRFQRRDEEENFRSRVVGPIDKGVDAVMPISYAGFVDGEAKRRLLVESDCFYSPSKYSGENFSIARIEAAFAGMPAVTTLWEPLAARLPSGLHRRVEPGNPRQHAVQILELAENGYDPAVIREVALEHFTVRRFLDEMERALAAGGA